MTYAEYNDVLHWYGSLAMPTEADFKKYSDAFFKWTGAARHRAEVKYPKKVKIHGCGWQLNLV